MLHYGKSSGIISDKKLIHLPLCYKYYYSIQGRNQRGQEVSNSPGAESLWGRRLTAGRGNFPTVSQILPSKQ